MSKLGVADVPLLLSSAIIGQRGGNKPPANNKQKADTINLKDFCVLFPSWEELGVGSASCLLALGCNLGVLSPASAQVDPVITTQSYTNDSSGSTLVPEATPKAQDNATTNLPTWDATTQVESNQDYELLSQVEQYSGSEPLRAIESEAEEIISQSGANNSSGSSLLPVIIESEQDASNPENELLSQIEQYSGSTPASAVPTLPENETLSQIEQYSISERPRRRRRSFPRVDSLVDVTPEDWAYDALRTLMNNYRCLTGYGDNTFRGNNNLTRYEFAATLNRCLQRVETIIRNNFDLATEEDLASIERLIEEFEDELAIVKDKVSDQEARVDFLTDNNFSTTTILRGQANFFLTDVFGSDLKAVPSGETPTEDLDVVTSFSGGVRLDFDTSFTGRDLLRTRIQAGNTNSLASGVTGTSMTNIAGNISGNNDVRLSKLFYRFPIGDRGSAYVAATGQSASDFVPALNPASTVALFGFYNPIYDIGFGTGGGLYYQLTDLIGVGASYYTASSSNPNPGSGLFNGDFNALGQITLTPSDRLGISLTYSHYYSPEPIATNNVTSFIGSEFAQFPFGRNTATSSDNFNVAASYQVNDRLQVGGWVGYYNASAESSALVDGLSIPQGSDADIWTWAFTASYNDLLKLGSNLSLILGLPPKASSNDIPEREDRDTSYHIELSYRYPITDRISITSGGFVILDPEHNEANDDIWVGLIRLRIDI
ncbi:MAG: iron uptake porin [Symploca sp. SIO1B1]|nr:iron uptake porin [Symploca sp. SIO1C2]NER96941.1 iron uptake porin [Symploca sp. SIO1B1]